MTSSRRSWTTSSPTSPMFVGGGGGLIPDEEVFHRTFLKLCELEPKSTLDLSSLERYVCHTVTEVLVKLFEKPYICQSSIDVKVREPFVVDPFIMSSKSKAIIYVIG